MYVNPLTGRVVCKVDEDVFSIEGLDLIPKSEEDKKKCIVIDGIYYYKYTNVFDDKGCIKYIKIFMSIHLLNYRIVINPSTGRYAAAISFAYLLSPFDIKWMRAIPKKRENFTLHNGLYYNKDIKRIGNEVLFARCQIPWDIIMVIGEYCNIAEQYMLFLLYQGKDICEKTYMTLSNTINNYILSEKKTKDIFLSDMKDRCRRSVRVENRILLKENTILEKGYDVVRKHIRKDIKVLPFIREMHKFKYANGIKEFISFWLESVDNNTLLSIIGDYCQCSDQVQHLKLL